MTSKEEKGQPLSRTEALRQIIQESTFDPDAPLVQALSVLTVDGVTVGRLGNFMAIIGKAKAGKTRIITAAEGSAYIPGDVWGIKITLPPGRDMILHVDTEQARYDFAMAMKDVSRHMGIDGFPRRIKGLTIRKQARHLVMSIIEQAIIDTPQAAVVVIDGYLDLVCDFNNTDESRQVADWLLRITEQYDILIIGVIHMNKRDGNALGHLGSSIERYGQSTIAAERAEDGSFTLECIHARGTKHFDKITIQEIDGRFVRTGFSIKKGKKIPEAQQPPSAIGENEHFSWMSMVMTEAGMKHEVLKQDLMEYRNIKTTQAGKIITYWQERGWVFKGADGLYHRRIDPKIRVF